MKQSLGLIALLSALALSSCAGAAAPMREAGVAYAPEAAEDFAVASEAEPQTGLALADVPSTRLVIRNADLTIVVADPAQSLKELAGMAEQMGGFVVSSSLSQSTFEGGVRAERGSITLRVPADRLDEALDTIKAGALEVRSENTSGQDVTEEYTDLQSRLRYLESAEAELLEIMDSAVQADDVLAIFERLRQLGEEIEVIKGRLQYLEQSARLSAVSVELLPDVVARPLQIGRWQPQGTAKEALEALINALQFLGDAAIWSLICILPVALILGVPGYFVLRAVRRARAKARPATEESAEG